MAATLIGRLRESVGRGEAITLAPGDCQRLLLMVGALYLPIENGFEVDEGGAGGRCLSCGWTLIRAAGESPAQFSARMQCHASHHRRRVA